MAKIPVPREPFKKWNIVSALLKKWVKNYVAQPEKTNRQIELLRCGMFHLAMLKRIIFIDAIWFHGIFISLLRQLQRVFLWRLIRHISNIGRIGMSIFCHFSGCCVFLHSDPLTVRLGGKKHVNTLGFCWWQCSPYTQMRNEDKKDPVPLWMHSYNVNEKIIK